MRRLWLAAALALGAPLPAAALSSAGVGNEDVSARVLGMGGVGTAQASDPAAAYLNPAALGLGRGTVGTAGATFLFPDVTRTSPAGLREPMRPVTSIVPNLAAGFPVRGRLRGSLAVESPYGGRNLYSDTGFAKYVVTKSLLKMVDLTPSLSYAVGDDLALAVSAHVYDIFDLTSQNKLNETAINSSLAGAPRPSPDADAELSADGSRLGAGLSAFWRPKEGHALGATWRSQATVTLKGNLHLQNLNGESAALFGGSEYRTGARFEYPMPQNLQLGYAYEPSSHWTLELDAAWYQWSALRNFDVRFDETDPNRSALLRTNSRGQVGPEPKDWRDTWNFALGAEYRTAGALALRGGYAYQPFLAPASTFHPESPDLTRHELAVGAGYRFPWAAVDLAYVLVLQESRDIDNQVGDSSLSSVDGKWEGLTQLLTVNFTVRYQ